MFIIKSRMNRKGGEILGLGHWEVFAVRAGAVRSAWVGFMSGLIIEPAIDWIYSKRIPCPPSRLGKHSVLLGAGDRFQWLLLPPKLEL